MSEYTERFTVVINEARQFSLLATTVEMPSGWRHAGFAGSEEACVSWVDERGDQPHQTTSTRSAPRGPA